MKISGPPSAGTTGGPKEEGGPSKIPTPPPPHRWSSLSSSSTQQALFVDVPLSSPSEQESHAREASAAAASLAASLWEAREEYMPRMDAGPAGLLSVTEAVEMAWARCQAAPEGSIVIGDGSDATTSGAPGDATGLLKALLTRHWPAPVLVPVVSPDGVAAVEGRCGAEVECSVGGRLDSRFGAPQAVRGTVRGVWDCAFTIRRGHLAGMACDLGRCAAVATAQNVVVILAGKSGALFAAELFEQAGYDPFAAGSVVVAKSPAGFRATYGDPRCARRAALLISCEQPGCAPPRYWREQYDAFFCAATRSCWPWARDREHSVRCELLAVAATS